MMCKGQGEVQGIFRLQLAGLGLGGMDVGTWPGVGFWE